MYVTNHNAIRMRIVITILPSTGKKINFFTLSYFLLLNNYSFEETEIALLYNKRKLD